MVRRFVPLLTLLLACFPPPLDESGRQCDDSAGRACGSGYVCFDGVCWLPEEVDAGPGNWLTNGGFEGTNNDAGFYLFQWLSAPGGDIRSDATYVHEGMHSARVFSADGGEVAGIRNAAPQDVRNTQQGQTWCAMAWVRSGVLDAGTLPVGIYLREKPNDGGRTLNENEAPQVAATVEWTRLEARLPAIGAERLDVRVQTFRMMRKGEALYVDDVRVKRSATDSCTW